MRIWSKLWKLQQGRSLCGSSWNNITGMHSLLHPSSLLFKSYQQILFKHLQISALNSISADSRDLDLICLYLMLPLQGGAKIYLNFQHIIDAAKCIFHGHGSLLYGKIWKSSIQDNRYQTQFWKHPRAVCLDTYLCKLDISDWHPTVKCYHEQAQFVFAIPCNNSKSLPACPTSWSG